MGSSDDMPGGEFVLHESQKFEDSYELHEVLGSGKFGTVYRCRGRTDGGIWAAKIIKTIRSKEKIAVKRELEIMSCLRHRTLLRCTEAFQTPKRTIMVMECITGGELFERITGDDIPLTEEDCISFMRQICTGVDHMHRNNILHLDLKPENIMCLDHTGYDIKIIDFGLAQRFQDGDQLKVLFGTPEFVAPEIVRYEDIGFGTDMWAVGVICYILLSGLSPFMGDDDTETLSNVTRGSWDFEDAAFNDISDEAKNFIEKILVFQKEERMSAQDCLNHPWLESCEADSGHVTAHQLSTERLKKFVARRRWQRTTHAVRAIGRMSIMRLATQQRRLSAPAVSVSLTSGADETSQKSMNGLVGAAGENTTPGTNQNSISKTGRYSLPALSHSHRQEASSIPPPSMGPINEDSHVQSAGISDNMREGLSSTTERVGSPDDVAEIDFQHQRSSGRVEEGLEIGQGFLEERIASPIRGEQGASVSGNDGKKDQIEISHTCKVNDEKMKTEENRGISDLIERNNHRVEGRLGRRDAVRNRHGNTIYQERTFVDESVNEEPKIDTDNSKKFDTDKGNTDQLTGLVRPDDSTNSELDTTAGFQCDTANYTVDRKDRRAIRQQKIQAGRLALEGNLVREAIGDPSECGTFERPVTEGSEPFRGGRAVLRNGCANSVEDPTIPITGKPVNEQGCARLCVKAQESQEAARVKDDESSYDGSNGMDARVGTQRGLSVDERRRSASTTGSNEEPVVLKSILKRRTASHSGESPRSVSATKENQELEDDTSESQGIPKLSLTKSNYNHRTVKGDSLSGTGGRRNESNGLPLDGENMEGPNHDMNERQPDPLDIGAAPTIPVVDNGLTGNRGNRDNRKRDPKPTHTVEKLDGLGSRNSHRLSIDRNPASTEKNKDSSRLPDDNLSILPSSASCQGYCEEYGRSKTVGADSNSGCRQTPSVQTRKYETISVPVVRIADSYNHSNMNNDSTPVDNSDRVGSNSPDSTRIKLRNNSPSPSASTNMHRMRDAKEDANNNYPGDSNLDGVPRIRPPIFVQRFHRIEASFPVDSEIKFEGAIDGFPKPEVTWLKDGAPIIKSHKRYRFRLDSGGCFSLVIPNVLRSDQGSFMCEARNSSGTARCIAELVLMQGKTT